MTKDELRARLGGRRLTGSRNQCPTCGELFNSFSGFDLHRVGRIGTPVRRCLSPAELATLEWTVSADGFWRLPGPEESPGYPARNGQSQPAGTGPESTIDPSEVSTHVPAEKAAGIREANARNAIEGAEA